MKYGSVCSGVEAATVAWHSLGWQPQWFSEIEQFPSAVLNHHYPNVPNFGDMTKYKEWKNDPIDLLVGGTPCQSFSVAGLRKGLDDPRGNLMLTYLAIAEQYRAKWLVWENVPGVLSSNGGKDFGAFLGALGQLGYGFAYRVLDAQYFGVPQRRKRVFVVGCLGGWRSAAAVLFESHSLQGHSAPSREEGEKPPLDVRESVKVYNLHSQDSRVTELKHVSGTVTSAYGTGGGNVPIAFGGQMSNVQTDNNLSQTLQAKNPQAVMTSAPTISATLQTTCGEWSRADGFTMISYDMKQHHNPQPTDSFSLTTENCSSVRGDTPLVKTNAVRRLTPKECERLQGFPDNYTQIPYRNKDADNCPDSPRYKAMGNSMAVPVMKWIGERIEMVEALND